MSTIYPEYEWLPWKFNRCPGSYWTEPANHKKFLDWLGKEIGIKEMSDWYNVTTLVQIYSIVKTALIQ